MLFFFLIASAYKAYAVPAPLGPEVFASTPFTFLFGRSPCNCGPQERALFEVIRSCAVTIFACVYTSLHPNVPDPKAKTMQRILGRVKMASYMLIAPEAVMWWAMRQLYGARQIASEVNGAVPDLKWTTTHGHFVQMGGLQYISPNNDRQVVDPFDLAAFWGKAYIQRGMVDPNELRIPKEQVEDRSKGDFLSKGFAAVQTAWFVLECIARFQQHLPVTRLEVITLAFAVLNAITYGLWWHKPLNVNCQVEIHIKPDPMVQANERQEAVPGGDGNENDGAQNGEAVELGPPGGRRRRHYNQAITAPLLQRGTKKGVGIWQHLIVRPFRALVLPIRDMFLCFKVKGGASHVPMFYAYAEGLSPELLLQVRLISCLIGMSFGGIHFIAWGSHFPTHIELIFWRASSLVIVVVPFFVALFGIVAGKYYYELTWKPDPDVAKPNFFLKAAAMVLYTLGPTLYIIARICLVVLAVLSLRSLPPTAFETVTWTSYIPHF